MSVNSFNWKAAIGTAKSVCRRWVNPDIQDGAEVSVQASLMAMLFLLPPLGLASAVLGFSGLSSNRLVIHLALAFALPIIAASLLSISGKPRMRNAVIMCLGPMAVLATATSPTGIVGMIVISALVAFSNAFGRNSARVWLVSAALSAAVALGFLMSENAPVNHWSALAILPALIAAALFAMFNTRQDTPTLEKSAQFNDLAAIAANCDAILLEIEQNGLVIKVGARPAERLPMLAEGLEGRGLVDRIHVADRPAFLSWIAGLTASGDRISVRVSNCVSPEMLTWHMVNFRTAKLQGKTYLLASIEEKNETIVESPDVSAILGKLGHELRTPLNAIAGFSEMLRDGHCGALVGTRQHEYVGLINRSAGHLLEMAGTMLEWSQLENNTRQMNSRVFLPLDSADYALSIVAPMAQAKRIGLEFAPNVAFETFDGDEVALTQILVNLLSNAVKFTPEGGLVSLTIDIEDRCLAIKIKDTGYGMTGDQKNRVGTPFYRAHSDRGIMADGVGLGLSIVRDLVKLHNGSIQIDSDVGTGTSVLVVLSPLKTRQTNVAVLHPSLSDESVRIINIHEERVYAPHRKTA